MLDRARKPVLRKLPDESCSLALRAGQCWECARTRRLRNRKMHSAVGRQKRKRGLAASEIALSTIVSLRVRLLLFRRLGQEILFGSA